MTTSLHVLSLVAPSKPVVESQFTIGISYAQLIIRDALMVAFKAEGNPVTLFDISDVQHIRKVGSLPDADTQVESVALSGDNLFVSRGLEPIKSTTRSWPTTHLDIHSPRSRA